MRAASLEDRVRLVGMIVDDIVRSSCSSACRFCLPLLGIALFGISLFNVVPCPARTDDLRFTYISLEDGLSQSFVYAVLQDTKGFMWFGTRDGLNKYDGYSFMRYTHEPFSQGAISSGVIRSISEDSRGGLWLGTFRGGLVRFDRATGRFLSCRHNRFDSSSLGADNIACTYIDSRGTLWVGAFDGGGLNRLDLASLYDGAGRIRPGVKPRFRRYRYDPADSTALGGPDVFSICEDSDGYIWAATNRALSVLDRRTGRFTRFVHQPGRPASVPWKVVHVVRPDPAGGVWVGTDCGLYKIDAGSRSYRCLTAIGAVESLMLDADGTVWFGAFDGLHALNPRNGRERRYAFQGTDEGPIHGTKILTLYSDNSGAIWIGTNNGIDRTSDRVSRFRAGFERVGGYDGAVGHDVRSLLSDRSGLLWIGFAGAGLELVNTRTGQIASYPIDPPSNHDYINTIYEDRSGSIWVGTRGRIRRGRPTGKGGTYRFDNVDLPDSLIGNAWAIHEDRGGEFWIGTSTSLSRFDPRSRAVQVFRHDPDNAATISCNGAWKVHEDRAGAIWIGTPQGLNRFDPVTQTFRRFQHNPLDSTSLSHNEVWSIFEDRNGTLWIGTWGGGLNRLDGKTGRFVHYMESDGLANNIVHGILQDMSGDLWISTGRGLSKFDLRAETFTNYESADGLQVREFNPNACCRTPDGVMIFGGLGGLTGFRPEGIHEIESRSVPVVVTSFRKLDSLFSNELTDGMSVEVYPGENTFSFAFAALDFDNSRRIRYAYMLEGFNDDWVYSGDRRYASYTNLDPGDYVFRVKATNADGTWQEPGIAVRVRVVPPFTSTFPFYALIGITLASVSGVWYRRRKNLLSARERGLDKARETERREIAAELHDGPLQDLYSLRFGLERLVDTTSDRDLAAGLTAIDDTLKRVRGSLRNICGDLQLPSFQGGLEDAIRTHASRFGELHSRPRLHLDLMPEGDRLPREVRENLFRIYRSAVSNVVKHADASDIFVRLVLENDAVVLEVRDNGRGFSFPRSMNALVRQKHYGLLLADAHARAAGGRLSVASAPGAGTTIRVEIENTGSRVRRLFGRGRSRAMRKNDEKRKQHDEQHNDHGKGVDGG